ncbi:MAG: hypothetical protein M3P98_03130 [bacterium]|nr:hypothetical protein [bacterium]
MKILLLLLFVSTMALGQRTSTIDADCLRIKDGTCIDKLELGYLDGVSSALQTQLNGKEASIATGTSAQYIRGDKALATLDKAAVGLSNVDNTSDATKNAASVTLTNKTLTSPVINSPTGIVKGDVGLGNVDNTSDATKNAASVTLTNKTISASSNTITGIVNANVATNAQIDVEKIGTGQVDNTELSRLDGITGNVQTQINNGVTDFSTNGVHRTGDESIAGVKTFTDQLIASSTAKGFRPCPVMTDVQMLAVGTPANGDCVYNSTKKAPYYYSSTDVKWKLAGGGAGGSRLNLLVDASFEDGVAADGSCATCTASQESVIILATPNNEKSLKLNFAAQNGCYTVDKTTGAEFTNTQGVVSAFIKTSVVGATFTSRVNGADTSNVITISSRDVWDNYEIGVILGATSVGYKICSGSTVTDDIYADETFVGPAKIVNDLGVIGKWTSYTPTFTNFGTVTSINCRHRQNGGSRDISCTFTTGTTVGSEARVSLPSGDVSSSDYPTLSSASGHGSGAAIDSLVIPLIEASVSYLTFSSGVAANNNFTKTNATFFGNTRTWSFFASVRIAGLSGSTSTYTSQCQSDTQCENVFSADVSSTGVVTNENLDWISGSCTNASPTVCTYNTGIFTAAPNCWHDSSTILIANAVSSSTTVSQQFSGSSKQPFTIYCTKGSADFKAKRVIVGDFESLARVATITDVKASGTAGGSTSAATTATRTLNTLVDPLGIVTSLSSNQFILPAGTYQLEGFAPGYRVSQHKIRLRNITDSTTPIIGSSEYSEVSTATASTFSRIQGVFTISSAKTFELQHYTTSVQATNGFGVPATTGESEVYAQVTIRRLR